MRSARRSPKPLFSTNGTSAEKPSMLMPVSTPFRKMRPALSVPPLPLIDAVVGSSPTRLNVRR